MSEIIKRWSEVNKVNYLSKDDVYELINNLKHMIENDK